MSAHTPGPWSLETVATSCGSCHKIGPFPGSGHRPEVHACVYADGVRIGIDDSMPVAQELLANARLIAAAPDLLDAVRYAIDNPDFDSAEFDRLARIAVAKATGELS